MASRAVESDEPIFKFFEALGIKGIDYVSSFNIIFKANSIATVEITYFLKEDSCEKLIELAKQYYLIEKEDGTDKKE
jgi:hypothetical protein